MADADTEDLTSAQEGEEATEVAEAVELNQQLGDAGDDETGIQEALQAWAAGGHTVEEGDDAEEVMPVQFAQLEPPPETKSKPRFNRLNNVDVDITVELGRKPMTVRELTGLKEQDVIDLDKLAGEAFDIMVNGRPFAEGEVVVVTDLMAVRITKLIERGRPEDEVS